MNKNKLCKIIDKYYFSNGQQFEVDHNHKTGKIRGLLCTNCNTALGSLQESKKVIQNLLKYLFNFKKEKSDEKTKA